MGVFLIGGSSHAGKSTVATTLSEHLGWRQVSTDSLGRHPGRPWSIDPAIAEHYRSMATDDLVADVLAHYERLWPKIDALISSGENLVLEGSALWPETVAARALGRDGVRAAWLTTGDANFRERIHRSSQYAEADEPLRDLIDRFVARTVRYDDLMMAAVGRLGLASLEVAAVPAEDLADRFLALVGA